RDKLTKKFAPHKDKITLLDNYGLDGKILLKTQDIKEKQILSEEERDILTELPDTPKEINPDEHKIEKSHKNNFFHLLTLYSRTIRNSEDISLTEKKKHLKYALEGYILLLAVFKE